MFHIVDWSHLVYRNYFVNQSMVSADGTPIGAVSGCCAALWRLVRSGPSHVVIVLDAGPSRARKAILPDYKAQRPPVHPDLKAQFPICREAAEVFGFPCVAQDGFEADDVVATYARLANEVGMPVLIYTTDKDLMQLVRPGVSIFNLTNNQVMTEADVLGKLKVRPDQVADFLALMGDASDNIPGVPGIGKETAANLLSAFGTLDEIIVAAAEQHDAIRPAIRGKLMEHGWLARKSKQLTVLDAHVPVDHDLEAFRYPGYAIDDVLAFCERIGATVAAEQIREAA